MLPREEKRLTFFLILLSDPSSFENKLGQFLHGDVNVSRAWCLFP